MGSFNINFLNCKTFQIYYMQAIEELFGTCRKVKHELRVRNSDIQVTSSDPQLRFQIHQLRVRTHQLRVQIHHLRVQIHELGD